MFVEQKGSRRSSGSRLNYFQENGKGYYLQSLKDVGLEQRSRSQGRVVGRDRGKEQSQVKEGEVPSRLQETRRLECMRINDRRRVKGIKQRTEFGVRELLIVTCPGRQQDWHEMKTGNQVPKPSMSACTGVPEAHPGHRSRGSLRTNRIFFIVSKYLSGTQKGENSNYRTRLSQVILKCRFIKEITGQSSQCLARKSVIIIVVLEVVIAISSMTYSPRISPPQPQCKINLC